MPRPSNWYPNKIYDLLYRLGHDNDEHLSYQEVGFMFLREALLPYGFDCNHSNVGRSKKDNQPYCKDCYSRLETIQERILR